MPNPLYLPEILTVVLREVYAYFQPRDDHTILACTLVNSSWKAEADKHIWSFCGEHELGRIDNPAIRHLVALDPQRQQHYANHIRVLRIADEEVSRTRRKEIRWEGQFHSQLQLLSFPRLEDLSVQCPSHFPIPQYDRVPLIPYLQPPLKSITIVDYLDPSHFIVSEKFLLEIASRCRNLQEFQLRLGSVPQHSLAVEAVVSFLRDMKSITRLCWQSRLPPSRTASEAFELLAQTSPLEDLEILDIWDPWIKHLKVRDLSPPYLFTSLQSLKCGISADGLEMLLPFLTGLRYLTVRAHSGSTRALSVIANAKLVRLEELDLIPCTGTTISAPDLLGLANSCTNLDALRIPTYDYDEEDSFPTFEGFCDAAMEELSANLPRLSDIHLRSDNSCLSEKSLISLGKNCPDLRSCTLTAKVDWGKLVKDASSGFWQKLWTFDIDDSAEEDAEQEGDTNFEDVQEIARNLVEQMPSLHLPTSNSNSALIDALSQIRSGE